MSEVIIGGSTFVVVPLPAMRSFVLQPRIAPVLAEVTATALEALREVEVSGDSPFNLAALLEADANLKAIAESVGRVCAKMPPVELESITRELLAGATIDNLPLFTPEGSPFDVRMRGRTMDVWRLLWHALKVNYPDFFGALGASGSRGAPAAAAPSAASSTSPPPGPSGA